MKNNTIKSLCALSLCMAAIPANGQQGSTSSALNKCAAIEDDGARLVCYDALAEVLVTDSSQLEPPSDAPYVAASAGAVAAVDGPVPLTDDVGKERVDPVEDEEQPRFAATVTSCRKNPQSGQYVFYFENDQVWKQSNYRALSLRNCEFDVEISKNAFGYEMYIPSKDRTVRISRLK